MVVYRLQNKYGHGPFYSPRTRKNKIPNKDISEDTYDQDCVKHLNIFGKHDPETMVESIGISQTQLKKFYKEGWLFGWSTFKQYRAMFKSVECRKLCRTKGMDLVVRYVVDYIVFPDGQVMFKPPQ